MPSVYRSVFIAQILASELAGFARACHRVETRNNIYFSRTKISLFRFLKVKGFVYILLSLNLSLTGIYHPLNPGLSLARTPPTTPGLPLSRTHSYPPMYNVNIKLRHQNKREIELFPSHKFFNGKCRKRTEKD